MQFLYACALFGNDKKLAHGLAIMDQNRLRVNRISHEPVFYSEKTGNPLDLHSPEIFDQLSTISNLPSVSPDMLFNAAADLSKSLRLGLEMQAMGMLEFGQNATASAFSIIELPETLGEHGLVYQLDPTNMNSHHLCFFMLISAFDRQSRVLRML